MHTVGGPDPSIDPKEMDAFTSKLEPAAARLGFFDCSQMLDAAEAVHYSTAISLKRIADALEKLNSGDVNSYGIGAEIGRGMGEAFVAVLNQNGR